MSRSEKNDQEHAATHALPRALPMPSASYWTAAGSQPWVAVDPVFAAECIALYRSIRLTLLALIAFLSGPRTLRADQTKSAQQISSSAPCAPQDAGGPATARRAVRPTRPTRFIRRTELTISTKVSFASDLPARDTPELTMQRTHAPPVIQARIAYCFSYHDLPPPGTIVSTSSEFTTPKQNSSQFVIKRTHAPPANLCTLLRSKNLTQHSHRFAPLQILAARVQRSLPGGRVVAGSSTSAVDNPERKQPQLRNKWAHAPPTERVPASLPSPKHFVHPSWFAAAIADSSPSHFSNMHVHARVARIPHGNAYPTPGDNDYVRF